MLKDLDKILAKDLQVYATRPAVPFEELGSFLTNKIIWVSEPDDMLDYFNDIKNSDIFIHTGWGNAGINKLDKKLRSFNKKIKIYVLVDNRFKKSLKQFMGFFLMQFKLKYLYDGFIVSGASAQKLVRFLGIPKEKIASGHYGAPSDLYPRWDSSIVKDNCFTFIGTLDKRKGADILLDAWKSYKSEGGTYSLNIIGEGLYSSQFYDLKDVHVHGFLQPKEASKILLQSCAFILPGRDDNWATVIAEACASGCIILSTKKVGAVQDLLDSSNGFLIHPNNITEVKKYLFQVEKIDFDTKNLMYNSSVLKSNQYDSERLTKAIIQLA
tara:strand:+ start:9270 stop:10247 length:978 start_codon:yes stop_codon:yes gene_type:complete